MKHRTSIAAALLLLMFLLSIDLMWIGWLFVLETWTLKLF